MLFDHFSKRNKATLVSAGYPSRVLACLVVLGIHLSLFHSSSNPLLWAFIIGHSVIYPHVIYYFSNKRQHEQRNILIDGFFYGCCVALWGLNPLSTIVFISGMWMTAFAAGKSQLLLQSMATMLAGTVCCAAIIGFEYRETLPLTATIITSVGLLGFGLSLSYAVVKINTNLLNVKLKLSEQAEQMRQSSELAFAVNAHLELDKIMEQVIQTLNQLYPFEQICITLLNEKKNRLVMLRSYGNALSPYEKSKLEGLTFSLDRDNKSIFVSPVLNNKPLYLKQVSSEILAKIGSAIDQRLYTIKPSKSIVYFPLSVEGKVIGGLGFINYKTPIDIQPEDIDRLSNYLIQVGTAIRNSQLFEEAQKSSEAALVAQQAAETSEAAKSHFLANMSHEIRTPMTAIIGYSESLLYDDIAAEEKDYFVETIIRSGKHLLTIINDILDLSKIEAHKLEVEKVAVPLVSLIRDLQAHMSLKAEEKGLIFNISPIFPLPSYFITDATRIKQVLFNLTSNAVKFTQKGSVSILIRYEEESDTLYFEVKDTGIGLTEEQAKRVFDPFVQADSSTTRKYGGTGLGLYISKQLTQLLGGEIHVDSQPGMGSEFSIALPPGNLSDAEWFNSKIDLENAMREAEQSMHSISNIKFKGKVLIAEDNVENQRLLTHVLGQMGIDITIVNNGKEALEQAANTRFDLIMLDIQMPEMGGEEAASKLKALNTTAPTIALTANVMHHQLESYRRAGFVDFIAKPFDRHHLCKILKKYLSEQAIMLTGNILIADDNPVNLKLLKHQIEKIATGIEVTTVYDGESVIKQVANHSFDLILLDMEMPIMGGIETLSALRDSGNATPIYIVTGNTSPEDIKYCASMGATGHIAKPIDTENLQRVCIKHLGEN
ncbi:response regulator [Alkalimarinus sediminis]|uniref:histidine kinase n=1 Tax=Alkalimarinus sediminis TaxID=1632866 RepID=A0A9E8KJD7_9ALTE|nr:response regulator [Alkalimarinus sediminis]UZW74931.1 response regulator [Alkalimarinus sediminis]